MSESKESVDLSLQNRYHDLLQSSSVVEEREGRNESSSSNGPVIDPEIDVNQVIYV